MIGMAGHLLRSYRKGNTVHGGPSLHDLGQDAGAGTVIGCRNQTRGRPGRPRVLPGVAAVPRGAHIDASRRHGARDGATRRLPLSLGQTDCESVQDRSPGRQPWPGRRACARGGWSRSGQREPVALSPVRVREETHRGHHRPQEVRKILRHLVKIGRAPPGHGCPRFHIFTSLAHPMELPTRD
jgi:hypothetical protein